VFSAFENRSYHGRVKPCLLEGREKCGLARGQRLSLKFSKNNYLAIGELVK